MGLNDLIALSTTVTAQDGATLTLASVAGLSVGDKIIVESQHGYNQDGLDGNFTISNFPTGSGYYTNVSKVGKSFLATISNVAGNTLTVDRTVPNGAVGLPCYRNNFDAVKYAIDNKLSWPANKRFAIGDPLGRPIRSYLSDDYAEIDFKNCELFAPKGAGICSIAIAKVGGGPVSNKKYKNLTLRGNVGDHGYCLSVETGSYSQGSSLPAAFRIFGTSGVAPSGPTNNVVLENFTSIDNWRAVGIELALDCFGINCLSLRTQPLRQYVQWEFQFASSRRCAFIDCEYDSDHMVAAFEAFKSIGCSFIRPRARNGFMAINTSGATLFQRPVFILDVVNPDASASPNNPLLNLVRTIETQQGVVQPGTGGGVGIFDMTVDYQAIPFPNNGATGEIWRAVAINADAAWGLPVNAKIYGIDFQAVRTDVTYSSGQTNGWLVDRNSSAGGTSYVERVTGDSLDSGTPLLNLDETIVNPE